MLVLFDKRKQLIPLKIWLEDVDQIEDGARQQALNLSRLPFAFHHIALMPDVHSGYGVPNGTVLAAQEHVIPCAVGFDIGCGVRSCLTSRRALDFPPDRLTKALSQIHAAVTREQLPQSKDQRYVTLNEAPQNLTTFLQGEKSPMKDSGTLGDGNHFIELQRDESDRLWVMIHAGAGRISREVAAHFFQIARDLCAERGIELPAPELSFLPLDTPEGQSYLTAMNGCLEFARKNRDRLLQTVLDILDATAKDETDVQHNYASLEDHFGRQVWVHRKGAIRVDRGTSAAIPGSMSRPSYIVKGKGHPQSYNSCAHGAGRKLGRREARGKMTVQQVLEDLNERRVQVFVSNVEELPARAPQTYKDIDHVMELQTDLVNIETKLTPLGVVRP